MSIRTLHLALFSEGRTDERFLPAVIRRTAEAIVRGRSNFDIAEVLILDGELHAMSDQDKRILAAAQQAANFDVLVIHADADAPNRDQAFAERVAPGFSLANQAEHGVCRQLVALIPVRMTEAWMLADHRSLLAIVGSATPPGDLKVPTRAKLAEKIVDPKRVLQTVLDSVGSRRRIKAGEIHAPLGENIDLARLQQLPSYQRFEADLRAALRGLGLID